MFLTENGKLQILFDEEAVSGEATLEQEAEESTEELESTETETLEAEGSEVETEQTPEETEEEVKLEFYDGRFRSVSELEKAYGESSKEAIKLKRERDDFERRLQKLETTPETPQEAETPKGPEIDDEEVEQIYLDKGLSAAIGYVNSKRDQALEVQNFETKSKELVSEAESFNQGAAFGRARELLYERAKASGNTLLAEKYSDDKYMPSIEEIEEIPEVAKQWMSEAEFVAQNFVKPIILNGRVITEKGKLPEKAFTYAARMLNYENDIKKATINAAEDTAAAISQEGVPKAKILTPTGDNKATPKVKFTESDDESTAQEKASQLSDEELDAEMARRGLA